MKLKLFFLTLLFSLGFLSQDVSAQLLQWNTFGNAGTELTQPSVANDPNISAANLTFGNGVTPAANVNRFGGINWYTSDGSLTQAVAGNDYIQFIVIPNAGFSFTPTSFVFNWDKSPTGPKNVVLRSSVDGFTSDLGVVAPTGAIGTSNTITISGLSNITTATTFRLYGYEATGTAGAGGFDIGSNVVNVQLNGSTSPTGPQPEINLLGNAVSIVSGDITPIAGDHTDFGSVITASGTIVRTFTIENTGTAALNLTGPSPFVTLSGANAADFTVSAIPSNNIAASGNTTFQVTFNPSADGIRKATVTIPNNDANENPYTFAIQGRGVSAPVITSVLTAIGNQGFPFNYTILATNAPTSYGASGLPAGLIINSSTGVITGAPSVSGVFNVTITATNAIGTATQTLAITLNVAGGTFFNPGELVFVGYDGLVKGGGNDDQYLFATLVEMLPGTSFSLVNSRYEAGASANVRTNKWGGGGDDASLRPYEVKLTYNGTSSIPAGSVLVFTTNGSPIWFGSVSVIQGTTSTTRTSEFSGALISPGNPNISSSGSDQMYLMQGSFTFDGSTTPNEANYFLSGTLLHGITNRASWVPLTAACNGDSTGANTRESRLPSALTCFNVENASTSSNSAFYENDKQHGVATIRQIVLAISDVTNNWTLGTERYTIDAASSATDRAGKTFLIGPSNPPGQWVGNVSTNWFNCANWEGLAVPNTTTNVAILPTSVRDAAVDFTANFSNEYNDIAVCNNITISDKTLLVKANPLNILNVYGNLTISGTGALDMDDSNPATPDGTLHLYGNWTNNVNNAAFKEGNGTVHFDGTNPQIINNVSPQGTEIFYNVLMNNNFTTSISNDLIAVGNLTVNSGKSVVVSPNDYIQVNKKLINNGSFSVLHNGSLVQVEDGISNIGNISYQRIPSVKLQDYVYWSSPVSGFDVNSISPATPAYYHWEWNPTILNPMGSGGNWVNASTTMLAGKGYIVRAPSGFTNAANQNWNVVFNNGVANNGVYMPTIARGNDTGVGSAGSNGIIHLTTDDNWNLLGNPYPSAISIGSFLAANPVLDGFVNVWSHGTLPSTGTIDPFYDNFASNYTAADYITINGSGATSGSGILAVIGGGQGFFVLMKEAATSGTPLAATALFNNSMRNLNYSNSQFYRTTAEAASLSESLERHRIWLDFISPSETSRTLIAYAAGATMGKDRLFDAFTDYKTPQNFYSLIDTEIMKIQGRALPFDSNDQVPMGFKAAVAGSFTIAIAEVDGIFGTNQNVYLEDKEVNVIHDLKANPYVFYATKGINNARFVLRYTNETLGNTDFSTDVNSIFVASNEGITVTSKTENIKEIEVYDVLGRKLYHNKNVEAQSHLINSIQKTNSGLILNITLENGNKVSKKTIY